MTNSYALIYYEPAATPLRYVGLRRKNKDARIERVALIEQQNRIKT